MNKFLFALLVTAGWLSVFAQDEVTEKEIESHIKFLTLEKNGGRYPGTKANKRVVKYIIKDFKSSGIQAFETGYKQPFEAKLRVAEGEPEKPLASTCNVIGFIEGNDPELKNEYIVLGAHYDHLGLGGPSSKSDKKNAIHFGADDNASGTAALLEISEKLAAHKDELKRSVIFIAFGAEEQGLLGSKYFTEHPLVPLENIKLMINMDMVGRLNDKKQVYMGGAGTFPGGVDFMKDLGVSLGLNPGVHAGSVGGSDHVSFYKKGISVLGMHTGGHPQYHTPEDTLEFINLPGEKMVCEYIFQTILKKASSAEELYFINQD
ncbi:M20/M25/M40 family metallo-hydrolase [Aestuariibaculum sp. YM273]|uniref:M28 family metallopeptidase n=1 Tax=Aestuariibaculum sp. YM273 TaxID=3070659 RepID=UPI0027DB57AF|nr:M20/M25/M40 family metallo-hydrolase [Aestuariibaculum sp. YM273]WMI66735.1 M20/M25/M40 family metallo-hydrolase [Aestuariibaculum sp. YM273]